MEATDGRLDYGSTGNVTNDRLLTLVVVPSYAEVDSLAEDERGALRATVRVELATELTSYLVKVLWEAAQLRAEVLLAAFFCDIKFPSEVYLLRSAGIELQNPMPELF